MADNGAEMMDPPKPPGRLYPGVRVDVLKSVIRETDANIRLVELFGKRPSNKLALVHKDKQFHLVNAHDIDLTNEQEKEFLAITQKIMSKYKIMRSYGLFMSELHDQENCYCLPFLIKRTRPLGKVG